MANEKKRTRKHQWCVRCEDVLTQERGELAPYVVKPLCTSCKQALAADTVPPEVA